MHSQRRATSSDRKTARPRTSMSVPVVIVSTWQAIRAGLMQTQKRGVVTMSNRRYARAWYGDVAARSDLAGIGGAW
jgi:hypothetical protein